MTTWKKAALGSIGFILLVQGSCSLPQYMFRHNYVDTRFEHNIYAHKIDGISIAPLPSTKLKIGRKDKSIKVKKDRHIYDLSYEDKDGDSKVDTALGWFEGLPYARKRNDGATGSNDGSLSSEELFKRLDEDLAKEKERFRPLLKEHRLDGLL